MNVLYSRDNDGNVPVHILGNGTYEIHKPKEIITCDSARQLIINLTGHPNARNWTFDRYFRQGIHASIESMLEPNTPILELFSPGGIVTDSGIPIPGNNIKTPQDLTVQSLTTKGKLKTCCGTTSAQDAKMLQNSMGLGIDLDKRGHEVAKLLFSGFKNWIFGSHYDPQDVLQEVYKGILIRNRGTCPFDVRKASFGHYVHQVCRCILSNYHRKEARRSRAEMVGMKTIKDGSWVETDVAEAMADKPAKDPRLHSTMADDLVLILRSRPTRDNRLAMRVIPLLGQGYTHTDLADLLDISKTAISKAMVTIRETARLCGYYPPSETV